MKTLAPFALLLLAVPAFAQTSPTAPTLSRGAAQAVAVHPNYSATPTGDGEPFAITCRPPQTLPGQRIKGPEVCKTNQVWAMYRRDGMEPAADGVHDVASERWRTINPAACRPASPGGGGTANMVYPASA